MPLRGGYLPLTCAKAQRMMPQADVFAGPVAQALADRSCAAGLPA